MTHRDDVERGAYVARETRLAPLRVVDLHPHPDDAAAAVVVVLAQDGRKLRAVIDASVRDDFVLERTVTKLS